MSVAYAPVPRGQKLVKGAGVQLRAGSLFLFESLQRPGAEVLLIVADKAAVIVGSQAVREAGALDVP